MTYLTFAQVAEILQVSPKTVAQWSREQPTFPVTRLPGRVLRIEQAALDRWLRRMSGRMAAQVGEKATDAPDQSSGAACSLDGSSPASSP